MVRKQSFVKCCEKNAQGRVGSQTKLTFPHTEKTFFNCPSVTWEISSEVLVRRKMTSLKKPDL